MDLGEKLLELRKAKHLSQEEVADKLNVSRQTISKWETNSSTPDFDKIIPICELYEISTEELLTGKKEETIDNVIEKNNVEIAKHKAKGIGIGVFSYFVAIVWIMITVAALDMDPVISSGIFLLICGIGTATIVYTCIVYKKEKPHNEKEEENNKLMKKIESIVSMIFLIIYLLVSFLTMAWHITWILWIVYVLVIEIIKLILMLRGDLDEE